MNRSLTRSKTIRRQSKLTIDVPNSSSRSVSSASSTASDVSSEDSSVQSFKDESYDTFAYSNFYLKLPNGSWMLRYRTGDRKILGTEEISGCYI
ncbi:hypothetical protein INT44_006809 [Umbelopsis vinacea]|uniref:Uncharacterized protein n=1 Tax=Umbelopsis vinacea TaxID=44442 RepID=A0A8H7U7P5_9FUNG|nr:hypothetical protein INT44_006809 [Umbelopsis vinacea]KAI9289840.1 hypothetical protein BC943DRAFT_312725 [Umbelopsis sp. AD052]